MVTVAETKIVILILLAIIIFFLMLSALLLDPIREGLQPQLGSVIRGVLPKKTQTHLAPPLEKFGGHFWEKSRSFILIPLL